MTASAVIRSQASAHNPIEKKKLDRLLGELRVPGGFDVAQLTRRPDNQSIFRTIGNNCGPWLVTRNVWTTTHERIPSLRVSDGDFSRF
jgi:hypothetical protein